MKDDHDIPISGKQDETGSQGVFDSAGAGGGTLPAEEAAPDDDVIELVNVLEPGKAPGAPETDLTEEAFADREGKEEVSLEEELPLGSEERGPDFLAEQEAEEETPSGDLMPEEPAREREDEVIEIELESGGGEPFDLEDVDEKLQFSFAETEAGGDDAEPVELKESDLEEGVLYDEDADVIGKVLEDEPGNDFERELDSMLDSLELTDDEEHELDFLEADLDSVSEPGAFEERAFAGGDLEGFRAAAGGLSLSGEDLTSGAGEFIERAPWGGGAVISEERLESIIARVAEKTAEKVARETMKEVAERVITQAIQALRESLEASETD